VATFDNLSAAPNLPPTLSAVASRVVAVNASSGPIPVTVGDAEQGPAGLVLTGSSSVQSLVPDANIVVAGTGADRTVTLTPQANQTGSTLITLSLTDGGVATTASFVFSVGQSPGDAWRQHYFGNAANSGDAADNADPDRDGIPNLLERAMGLLPGAPGPVSALPAVTLDGDTAVLNYTHSINAIDLTLQAQWSNDLVTWSSVGIQDMVISSADGIERRQARVPRAQIGSGGGFFRLVVAP